MNQESEYEQMSDDGGNVDFNPHRNKRHYVIYFTDARGKEKLQIPKKSRLIYDLIMLILKLYFLLILTDRTREFFTFLT